MKKGSREGLVEKIQFNVDRKLFFYKKIEKRGLADGKD